MDWYHDRDLTTEQADYLYGLEDLRRDNPIVWALIQGLHTSQSIAKLINWPHDWTLIKLRELKSEGLVWDSEGKASVLWHFHPDEEEHLDYQRWVAAQRQPGGIFNPRKQDSPE
jgi:hypothetical protein